MEPIFQVFPQDTGFVQAAIYEGIYSPPALSLHISHFGLREEAENFLSNKWQWRTTRRVVDGKIDWDPDGDEVSSYNQPLISEWVMRIWKLRLFI